MRYNLCRLGMCQYDTVLLWFSMLCMFYGSFRVHEVFPRKKSEYDPDSTLLRKDITLQTVYISGALVEVLMTNIKGPKEAQGNSVKVELFANGTKSCPVKADKKLLHFWGHGKNWQVQLMTKMNSTLMMGREIQNWYWNWKLKLTIEIKKLNWKLKLKPKFEIENWYWKLELRDEIENWQLKLKNWFENWNWNWNLKIEIEN